MISYKINLMFFDISLSIWFITFWVVYYKIFIIITFTLCYSKININKIVNWFYVLNDTLNLSKNGYLVIIRKKLRFRIVCSKAVNILIKIAIALF